MINCSQRQRLVVDCTQASHIQRTVQLPDTDDVETGLTAGRNRTCTRCNTHTHEHRLIEPFAYQGNILPIKVTSYLPGYTEQYLPTYCINSNQYNNMLLQDLFPSVFLRSYKLRL